jgi:hypothetical protein
MWRRSRVWRVSRNDRSKCGFPPPQWRLVSDPFSPIQAPALPHPRSLIELPAVEEPHQGTSYNPPLTAHQELLLKAHQLEMKRLEEEHALAQIEAKFGRARVTTVTDDDDVEAGVAPGMTVDDNNNNHDDDNAEAPASGEEAVPKPLPKRKTKQQRNKAARLKAEVRPPIANLHRPSDCRAETRASRQGGAEAPARLAGQRQGRPAQRSAGERVARAGACAAPALQAGAAERRAGRDQTWEAPGPGGRSGRPAGRGPQREFTWTQGDFGILLRDLMCVG